MNGTENPAPAEHYRSLVRCAMRIRLNQDAPPPQHQHPNQQLQVITNIPSRHTPAPQRARSANLFHQPKFTATRITARPLTVRISEAVRRANAVAAAPAARHCPCRLSARAAAIDIKAPNPARSPPPPFCAANAPPFPQCPGSGNLLTPLLSPATPVATSITIHVPLSKSTASTWLQLAHRHAKCRV